LDATSTIRTVLITGCSSGIGLCLAHGLRSAGYHVFATARKDEDVTKLKKLGFDAFLLDLASSNSIKIAIYEIYQKTDSLYTLINNGAYGQVPESVLRCVLHALESKVPKNLYRVTFPTKLFAFLCRILPSSWMDNILSMADNGDKD